jgi:hypothetical protein
MPERTLDARWRLLAASFRAAKEGADAAARYGESLGPALDLCVYALTHDVATYPKELDRQQVLELLSTVLPGRIEGSERWRGDVPEVLEAFLEFVAREEGVPSAWEWTSATNEGRALFLATLRDPGRARLGSASKGTPDRRPAPKIGRNDPCFCGSGRKYKQCCLKLA